MIRCIFHPVASVVNLCSAHVLSMIIIAGMAERPPERSVKHPTYSMARFDSSTIAYPRISTSWNLRRKTSYATQSTYIGEKDTLVQNCSRLRLCNNEVRKQQEVESSFVERTSMRTPVGACSGRWALSWATRPTISYRNHHLR